MLENLKKITQSGIRKLLKERLENPEKYVDKPLIIWRSDFRDGIQDHLLRNVLHEYNQGKEKDEQKWFLSSLIGDENQTRHDFSVNHIIEPDKKSLLGIYVIEPVFAPVDYNQNSYGKYLDIINHRKSGDIKMVDGVPVVAYMCHNYDWFETPEAYPKAEQYIFKPDFKEFEDEIRQLQGIPDFLIDFLKSKPHDTNSLKGEKVKSLVSESKDNLITTNLINFSEGESTYRWYNRFNYSGEGMKGCDFPECWFEALKNLQMEKRLSRFDRFSEIDEQDFNLAFSGISYDLVEEFRNFIIENNL